MGNKRGPFALLASLATASVLCLGASAWAQQVSMGNFSGDAGGTVQASATLSVGGVTPGIAGAQNDFSYDSANIAVQGKKVCKSDPTTSCNTDQECVEATGTPGDTCIVVPDCTVNSAIKKEATQFGFLPADCAGNTLPVSATCTGVRAIVFSISAPNRLIPDGATLYTCPIQIAGTASGNFPLTVSNVSLSFPTPPGGSVPGATGVSGSVQVGAVTPPVGTATSTPVTPVVEVTNTPTKTPVTPVVSPSATPTRTLTRTPTPSVTPTSGGVCPTCPEDDDGCQIGASGHGPAWLLLIPAIGLLAMRRRRG